MSTKHKTDFLLTKIIATLGPASEKPEIIRKLIEHGVRVFRINFSHGTFEEHERLLRRVRQASAKMDVPVAVLGDLSGPKIRVGKVIPEGVMLKPGMRVAFQKGAIVAGKGSTASADEIVFSTTYPKFIEEVQPGQAVLLDDGAVRLKSLRREGEGRQARLICKVMAGGLITSHKGVNLPDTDLSVPALTPKDYRCAAFAVEKEFDYLALSFVRRGHDVRLLKNRLRKLGARPKAFLDKRSIDPQFTTLDCESQNFIPVISKIEKPQAIDNLEEILDESDGIMVARGDLGVEMDLAEVAVLQKQIIHSCREKGMPVIVATQMLQSMIESPAPTRAEVSDVANSIFDGVDAVMLSGETAVGRWPVETVRMMSRIARRTNAYLQSQNVSCLDPEHPHRPGHRAPALAHGVKTIMQDIDARLIVVWSQLGGGALYISQHRIPRPIIAFTSSKKLMQQAALLYGLTPIFMQQPKSSREFLENVDRILLENKWSRRGEPVVVVSSEPIDKPGISNKLVIHFVGETGDAE